MTAKVSFPVVKLKVIAMRLARVPVIVVMKKLNMNIIPRLR